MEREKIVSVVNELIAACYDSEESYKLAGEKTDNSQLQELFAQHAAQRGRFAIELTNAVVHELGDPKTSGTLGGTVRRGWLNVKALITGGSPHAVLSEIEKCEDQTLSAYDKAMGQSLPDPTHNLIQRQYADIKAAHDQMVRLRDSYAAEKF